MKRLRIVNTSVAALCVVLAVPSWTWAGAAPAAGDKSKEDRSAHLEQPRDRYLPTPAQPPGPRHRLLVSRDGFVSVQVNTDEFGNNIVGDAANEPSIAVDPTDSTRIAIGWRQFDNVGSDFRQAGWGYSTDGGNTWTFPGVIEPGVFRSDPVLSSDASGNFFYNSLTNEGGYHCHVFKSVDGGATWDSGVYAHGGDKQWQIIDQTGGIGGGNIYASWNSSFSSCSGNFTRSYDGGQSFVPCTTVAGDPYWGTLAVGPDGELYVSGTGMTIAKSSTMQDPGQPAAWDFSDSVSLDGSLSFSTGPNPAGLLGQNWVAVDHSNGPTRGNVYMLASVNRSSNPDPMDVMFARSEDGGVTWSAPVRVNDDPGTTAWQWFGTMSVAPDGRIDAVWLDTRNDTTGGYLSELYYSYSTDAGVTWAPNVALTPAFDPHVGWPQQNKMGDYFHMVSDEFGADLAYAATFNGEQDVYFARIGDPACPDAGRVTLDRPKYGCNGVVQASVIDCGLNTDDNLAETVVVDIGSDSETGVETITLTETHPASALFEGSIGLSPTNAPGILLVTEGDTVTVTYIDADDGAGGTNVAVTATAPVDCTAPILSNVDATDLGPRSATVTFDADEAVRGAVHYGLACAARTETASGRGYALQPEVALTGLTDDTTYFFAVEGEDEAGNVGSDDNGGLCYSFTTPMIPDFYTEQFTAGLDLEGLSITFEPNGTVDFYGACPELLGGALPTDPVGGTDLNLGDDQPASFTLSGGNTVSLYGVSYGTVWVGPNGYLTFGGGDSDYSETFADHFSQPRVAALFDDLNPTIGTGAVTWLELADRVAVTWEGVAEYSTTNSNTFQIEMFFDGTIRISWLNIDVQDAIAGISEGNGLDPDFLPTDLSEAVCELRAVFESYQLETEACATGMAGLGNDLWEAGEQIEFSVTVRNIGAEPITGAAATVTPVTPGVTMLDATAGLGDIAPGATVSTHGPNLIVQLPETMVCGQMVDFDVAVSSHEGSWPASFQQMIGEVIAERSGVTLSEDFTGGIPATWTVIDRSRDANPDGFTWYADSAADPGACGSPNPGAPVAGTWAAVDSSCTGGGDRMDEDLITPVMDFVDDPIVTLEFDHWFAANQNEIADVDVRSSLTGGAWVNVARFTGTSTTNPQHEVIDISAQAGDAPDVEIRWHYHDAQSELYWYVDNVVVHFFAPEICNNEVCVAPISSPPPIPSGSLLAGRMTPDGSEISVAWDDQCAPVNANLLYGPLGQVSTYTVSGAVCGILNPETWAAVPAGDLWFVLVGDDGVSVESSWGLATEGERNGLSDSGMCAVTAKDITGTCP